MPANLSTSRRDFIKRATMTTSAISATIVPLPSYAQSKSTGVMFYSSPKQYDITHGIRITNGTFPIVSLEAWLPVPDNHPEQKIENLTITPVMPVLTDRFTGVKVARFYLPKSKAPAEGGTQLFSMNYRTTSLKASADSKKLNAITYQPYKQDKPFKTFTKSEKRLQTTHVEIRKLAQKFKGSRRSSVHIARLIFDFVIENTKYKLMHGKQGSAVYCLENKHGECTEYSALFTTLCRAAGIPARPVAGCWADIKNGWHVWSEFMLPSGEWIPVDANLGDDAKQNPLFYFGGIENRRTAFCKSFEVKIPKLKGGLKTVDILHFGSWWWTSAGNVGGKSPYAVYELEGKAVK